MPFDDNDLKRTDIDRWYKSFQKTTTCWNWIAVIGSNGYGRFWAKRKLWLAHRFAFMLSGRLIPDGLVVDHVCRNRLCVNPDHLRLMTSRENTLNGIGITAIRARREACDKGHSWAKTTIRVNPKTGGRQCEICRDAGHKDYLKKNADKIKETRKRRCAERAI